MNNQKGLSSIVIILIIIVLFAGGIFAWWYFGKPGETTTELPEKSEAVSICKILGNKDDINFCSGVVTRDISFCNKAGDWKEVCLDEVAFLTKDIELCRKVEGNCYGGIAAVTQDLTICEEMKEDGGADACFAMVAGYNRNASFCQNIKDEKVKTRCEYVAKGDSSLCKELETKADSIRCWGAIAILEKNPTFCKETDFLKSWCYQSVAIKTKDSSICQKILDSDVPQPEYDYLMCMAFAKKDVSFCEELSTKGYVKEECLFVLAKVISKANIFSPPFGYVSAQE